MKLVGIGIDTARYGHMASFIGEDRNPVAQPLEIRESRDGYEKFEKRLGVLKKKYPDAEFLVHVDAAGQYARNLLAFLRSLPVSVSVGEPKRNRDYRASLVPKNKSDKSESWALARFAVAERPRETPAADPGFVELQEIAGRLQAQSRELTRHLNQLHGLISQVFPELEFHVTNLARGYVLELLAKYPSAERVAAARLSSLNKINHLSEEKAKSIHEDAKRSIASLKGEYAEALVREAIKKVHESLKRKQILETLLTKAFDELPETGQQFVKTIPGIGAATAAVLVAKMISIERFETPKQLVSYFGAFPEASSSGFNKDGSPKPPTMKMSKKGNDLVRAYLWNAAFAAIRFNEDVEELYKRKRAEGMRGDTALGHCMRKLLHQVFYVWKRQQPFKSHVESKSKHKQERKEAAGPKVVNATNRKEVTTATPNLTQRERTASKQVDFKHLRSQIDLRKILEQLKIMDTFRGPDTKLRGPCPLHKSKSNRSRSLSIDLERNIFQCFNPTCQSKGNALDFWATLQDLSIHEAALDLAQVFGLEINPEREEEPVKQNRERRGDITPDPT